MLALSLMLLVARPTRTTSPAEAAAGPSTVASASHTAPATPATSPSVASPATAGATLSSATTASARATAGPTPAATAATPVIDRAEIIAYLGSVISWHRQTDMQVRLSTEPEEALFVADDRRMADEVVRLAFDFARAAAQLLRDDARQDSSAESSSAGAGATRADAAPAAGSPRARAVEDLLSHRSQMEALLEQLQTSTDALRRRLSVSTRRGRAAIEHEVAANQAQIELVRSRLDSFDALIDFEKGTVATRAAPLELEAQIDALERSVAQEGAAANANVSAGVAPVGSATPSVLPGNVDRLLALRQKEQTLAGANELTEAMRQSVARLRDTLVRMLAAIDQEALAATTQVGNEDLPTVRRTKAEFQALAARSKLISSAMEPLSRQIVLLQLYSSNLERWRASVNRRFHDALRRLLLRSASLALVFGVVFAAAAVWRRLTFRYVEDLQRRQKLLKLRRLAVIAAVAFVLVLSFASQLNTLATVMGFAAAGIALALQNVILSIAGYFYLSGRFGLRVGDRVQIAGVTGDVLESGFFKLTLMELGGDEHGRLPTGRAVILPNSVIFQSNNNFFRQLPKTSFGWHELRLALAPECDYRQAEKLVTDVVNEVFARYRDTVQREYRAMEDELNLRIETPRPQSRLQFGTAGLEMVVRYPTRLSGAVQTADEITRRLIDAIKREPGLRLAVPGPSIQAESAIVPASEEPHPPPEAPDHAAAAGGAVSSATAPGGGVATDRPARKA